MFLDAFETSRRAASLLAFLWMVIPAIASGTKGRSGDTATLDEFLTLSAGRNHARSMEISFDGSTGAATISIDGEDWFDLKGGMTVMGWNENQSLSLVSHTVTEESHRVYQNSTVFGPYTNVTFVWSTTDKSSSGSGSGPENDESILHTSFLVFHEREAIVFEQYFVTGWTAPREILLDEESPPAIVAGFPEVFLELPRTTDMGFLWWGGCFAAETYAGDWSEVVGNFQNSNHWFDGNEHGQPWVLHDETGRTVVWSSLDNFFVSGFASENSQGFDENQHPTVRAGLRTTLSSIPRGHRHATLLVGGSGINATLMEWGDVLLETTGGVAKRRTKGYADFALAHLGYWTDNGAYHYHGAKEDEYANMEEALLGIKEGMRERQIPIRYIQWDDWWMEKIDDFPGMISWTPKPDVFPSGFSDWLGMPLALYAPAYFAQNVWRNDYSWKVDSVKNTSIPIDSNFYMDLFRNGTSIGMKFFEQDFLCSLPWAIGSTSLTTQDVDTGKNWFSDMNRAAEAFGIHLQFCMADVYHILQATSLPRVTNARATGDNTRDYSSILSMGQSSLLFYATGIYASRDNVWTSNAEVKQEGCGNRNFCYEPNAHLDNAVAVLSGGPYGIADGLSFVNETIVHRSCRKDGVLLRARWPLASLDFTFTDADAKGSLVWAAHDEFGTSEGLLRWSYVIGVDLEKDIDITPGRLLQGHPLPPSEKMLAWEVVIGQPVTHTVVFSETTPFALPKSKPLNLPYDVDSPPHTHYTTAPVLSNRMVLLGEVSKWATMSYGRVVYMEIGQDHFDILVYGAPSETITFAYVRDVLEEDFEVQEAQCIFPSQCPHRDGVGNEFCIYKIFFYRQDEYKCNDVVANEPTKAKNYRNNAKTSRTMLDANTFQEPQRHLRNLWRG